MFQPSRGKPNNSFETPTIRCERPPTVPLFFADAPSYAAVSSAPLPPVGITGSSNGRGKDKGRSNGRGLGRGNRATEQQQQDNGHYRNSKKAKAKRGPGLVTGQTRIGKHGKTTELDIEEPVMASVSVEAQWNRHRRQMDQPVG